MVVNLSQDLLEALLERAREEGRNPNELIDEAVREYLISASITDLSPGQIAETQMHLAKELKISPYDPGGSQS